MTGRRTFEEPTTVHGTCPYCDHNECYSEWADGGYYCHSCTKSGKGRKTMTKEEGEVEEELTEKSVVYRGISKEALDHYGITTSFNKTGKEVRRVYPYPHRAKFRYLPKDFSRNAGFTNDHLFGMDRFHAGSSKYLTIVEGEDDVPSTYDMLGFRYPVVGIPGASVSTALLKNCHEYIDSFEEIIVATDNDEAGDRAANKLAAAFPNKVYRAKLSKHNDPNEYLINGDVSEFKKAWGGRTKYVPEYDTSTPEQYLKLLEDDDDAYLPTGIDEYDDRHMGLFQGHVTLIQAPEGTGKTEVMHLLEYTLITKYPDVPFASCHLEESRKRTTLAWCSYDLNKNVTRTDLITDMPEVQASIKKLTTGEQAHLFTIGTDEDPMVLLDRVKYYANVCGCKYVFIEPIQDLAQQYHGPLSTERFLSKIGVGLARIASETGVGIVLIGHENDEGQISDCRKLSKSASVVIRLERDLDALTEEERNITTLVSKKNRPSSYVGYGGMLIFDTPSFTLKEYTK